MGDDDRLLPNYLSECARLIEVHPGLGVYHAWTEMIDEDSAVIGVQEMRPEYETAFSMLYRRWNGQTRQFIGDFCFDTAMLKQDGGFYKLPLAWGSDDISAFRAAAISGIANTQNICFQYRENRHTITKSGNFDYKIEAAVSEYKWFQKFFSEVNKSRHNVHEELVLYRAAKTRMKNYYEVKISTLCGKRLRSKPLLFIRSLRQMRRLNFSFRTCLRSLYVACKPSRA